MDLYLAARAARRLYSAHQEVHLVQRINTKALMYLLGFRDLLLIRDLVEALKLLRIYL